jgi:MFS family permease
VVSWLLLRPDPAELADRSDEPPTRRDAAAPPAGGDTVGQLLRIPHVATALATLATGQVVMVLVMTMTPLHMTSHGHDIDAVGLVLSAHIFGMYALSPVSGMLSDRLGTGPVITAGLVTLGLGALLAALAPADGGALLFLALFILGYGWNLGFVAGSAHLAHGLAPGQGTRLEGATDALVWSSAAAASIGSGLIVAAAGFVTLALLGAAVALVGAVTLASRRGALAAGG